MEHRVGEVFDFEGTALRVIEDRVVSCGNCFFYITKRCDASELGMSDKGVEPCSWKTRNDMKDVIFVKDEEGIENVLY